MTPVATGIDDVLAGRRSWHVEACDVLEGLARMPSESVHCVVTSVPYYGLRDYGTGRWEGGDEACEHKKVPDAVRAVVGSTLAGGKKTTGHQQEGYRGACGRCGAVRVDRQIGLEDTLDAYLGKMVAVFREVRRVLRRDGTLWLNCGDSHDNKQLQGVPWRIAFALQADGYYLRSDIVWAKPNPMPESVTDRPTRSHEYVFLLTRSARYHYDADAVREAYAPASEERQKYGWKHIGPRKQEHQPDYADTRSRDDGYEELNPAGRNRRTVWTIATEPFPESHFAVFPTALVEPCVLAGTSAKGCCPACGSPWRRVVEKSGGTIGKGWHDHSGDLERGQKAGTVAARGYETYRVETTGWEPGCRCDAGPPAPCVVLDPFAGSGTTLMVALRHDRRAIGLELNPSYVDLARRRIVGDSPMFNGLLNTEVQVV